MDVLCAIVLLSRFGSLVSSFYFKFFKLCLCASMASCGGAGEKGNGATARTLLPRGRMVGGEIELREVVLRVGVRIRGSPLVG